MVLRDPSILCFGATPITDGPEEPVHLVGAQFDRPGPALGPYRLEPFAGSQLLHRGSTPWRGRSCAVALALGHDLLHPFSELRVEVCRLRRWCARPRASHRDAAQRGAFGSPMERSTQCIDVAAVAESKALGGRSASSSRATTIEASGTSMRRSSASSAPGSSATTSLPESITSLVERPVPAPTSRTRACGPMTPCASSASWRKRGYGGRAPT